MILYHSEYLLNMCLKVFTDKTNPEKYLLAFTFFELGSQVAQAVLELYLDMLLRITLGFQSCHHSQTLKLTSLIHHTKFICRAGESN